MGYRGHPVRVLIIPGLHGSGPAHWQSWLQARLRGVRVEQSDWRVADLERWSARIGEVIDEAPQVPHVAVAHSFGCLALAHCLWSRRDTVRRDDARGGVRAALLVAPADPDRFGVASRLPQDDLGVPSTVLASDTDPWMAADSAARWAAAWGSAFINLGDAGHINTEAGFGPLPRALHITQALARRVEQARRPTRAHLSELSFAV
jgi:predicted alpha/beta hydrolase family esterase